MTVINTSLAMDWLLKQNLHKPIGLCLAKRPHEDKEN